MSGSQKQVDWARDVCKPEKAQAVIGQPDPSLSTYCNLGSIAQLPESRLTHIIKKSWHYNLQKYARFQVMLRSQLTAVIVNLAVGSLDYTWIRNQRPIWLKQKTFCQWMILWKHRCLSRRFCDSIIRHVEHIDQDTDHKSDPLPNNLLFGNRRMSICYLFAIEWRANDWQWYDDERQKQKQLI